MAEYIKKEDLKFLEIPIAPVIQGEQVHYEQGFLEEWLESVPTADVVERAEHDRVVQAFKALIEIKNGTYYALKKEYAELKINIDKTIEEITNCVVVDKFDALEILKRNIEGE